MSRRAPNPAAERAAQNTQTIKSLLKLECNKVCADCKRNKHPRWASWNLGIFICIRCSGIHRGMGTHISRVKSVDLDAWTDEQLASVLKWGNARANKYWEAKLAPGHVPSEAKIENFIRTKYESKRWVMDGPIPDPATLDVEGDDDIPLNLVKEKQNLERAPSLRGASSQPAPKPQAKTEDLFGDIDAPVAPRSSSAAPPASRVPQKAEAVPPKSTKPADSLLGLDFFGTEAPAPSRSANSTPVAGAPSRPDLKQSILSLYSSAPRPQPQQQSFHSHSGSFGGMQAASPPPTQQPQKTSLGGLDDAFSGLSFSSTSPPATTQSNKTSAFSNLGTFASPRAATTQVSSPPLSGGGFFDAKPAPQKPPTQSTQPFSTGSSASTGLADLFDFSSAPQSPPRQNISSPPAQSTSVFNLSNPAPQAKPSAQPAMTASSGWGNNDAWGSSNAWTTPDNSSSIPSQPVQSSTNSFGWGSGSLANQSIVPGAGGFTTTANPSVPPKVSADEDFGGWNTAPPAKPAGAPKPGGGFAGSEDLFSNVWQ
ncbi:stromal membrane-associated protein-like protein [Xylogone sp. PMI_703]|nr:stromal membrane-associated protein-like protein [Xylogone sp. PMI_703]